jgi:methyl-accepting chemotaxis protein|nr:methyl-accepting chemotaxis protein [Kofleriaceae bacterium]
MATPITHKRRIPMFFKLLAGCLVLAAALIVGGTYVVQAKTQLRSRGNYLAKAERRLDGYINAVGASMTGTVELLANDSELRDAVSAGSDAAKAHASEMYTALASKYGVKPDLFAVYTTQPREIFTIPGSPLTETELPELGAVDKSVHGTVFAHEIQLIGGIPYQVSAVPIRSSNNKDTVGGLLMGVKLDRYLDDWAVQSDEDPELRYLASVQSGITVLASSWPNEERDEVAHALSDPDKHFHITIGEDSRDVIRLKVGDFDYYGVDLNGYKGTTSQIIGKLYITRSRIQLQDPATVPWIEVVAGVALSILIALAMAFWITRPIKQFVTQSRGLLQGDTDLTQQIVIDSRDETADLAENINQVFSRLHRLASGVQSAAFQVGASSAEISAASKQMLSGLKDQTMKIESSTTAVTELSASIQQVAGNAAEATTVAEKSSVEVSSAVQRMDEIRAAVDDAAEKMRELGESSKRIGNIVEVIRQISEQTSMLALNASIEAAHAGEQGRGFAVVADEVSSLARRVGQSAKDIEALIQTVKEQTQAAMASMEVGTREVGNGSALVTGTLTGLSQLITVVKDTAVAVQEQAVVSDEIARNMDAVRHIATEVLSGSEESVVQAERLHELAFELEESIGGFNLEGAVHGSASSRRAAAVAAAAAADKASGAVAPTKQLRAGAKPRADA